MKKANYFLFIGVASVVLACGPGTDNSRDSLTDSLGVAPGSPNEMNNNRDNEARATATLASASGSNVTGTATFTQTNGNVRLVLEVKNLTPGGTHAVHLHENGDCSAEDASSAGPHWNPTQEDHGKRGEGEFHSGDIANLEVDNDGNGSIEMEVDDWTIGGSEETNILNKAVIIHADPDDFTSQPSGNAGARVACGVIQAAN